jgi:type IV pilus assembly protein PilA
MTYADRGFTLIELMIVVAILGIMASMAVPTYHDFVIRSQIEEGLQLSEYVQKKVTEYYEAHKQFPVDNQAAGLSEAKHLIGNFVTGIEVNNGAIHITLGHRINAHVRGKTLTLRPAYVTAQADNPISWLCGYAQAAPGMSAQGDNHTTLPQMFLSPKCRSWKRDTSLN